MSAAGGSQVRIFDPSQEQLEAASEFFAEHREHIEQTLHLNPPDAGSVTIAEDLESAVSGAWMVIEAAPERLELKRAVFAELDRLADADAVLARNSSSLASSH